MQTIERIGFLDRGRLMDENISDNQCDARRSDGVICLDESGHYGGHIWPEPKQQVVVVGDTMRISVELLKQIDEQPDYTSVLVRLREVRHEPDGSKTLVVNRVDKGQS